MQMVLPMAEMMGWLRQGVGDLIRQAGLQLIGAADGRRSPGTGGRAQPAAAGAQGEPVGQGARLSAW